MQGCSHATDRVPRNARSSADASPFLAARGGYPSLLATVIGALLGGALLVGTASAAYVTIEMVTPDDGKMISLDDRQVMWKSPFGGWGLRALPFYATVGDKRVFRYLSAERRLMSESMGGGTTGGALGALMDDAMGNTAVKEQDLLEFKFERPASVSVDLAAGEHTFSPFGIKFAVDDDGVMTSSDPRVVIDPKGRRMQVICHPVVVRLVAGPRSMEGRQRWQAEGIDLLGGIEDVFAEYKKLTSDAKVPADKVYRSVMLYLPASAPGETYDVENVAFTVDAEGLVKLVEGAQARCEDGNRIYVETRDVSRPSAARSSAALLSISWFGASGEVRMSCGQESVAANAASDGRRIRMKVEGESVEVVEGGVSVIASEGASVLPVPATGNASVTLNELTVALPAATAELPHRLLLWDVEGAKCWVVASAPPEARPGGPWSCRITAGTREAKIPATLNVQLDPVSGGGAGSTLTLTGDANGVFSGALPSTPGFWRLRVADEGGLKGQTLGLALIADKAVAGVSLFTVNNRALYRRGDTFDLLWLARLNAKVSGAVQWPVRLRGLGLDTVVAQLAVSAERQAAGAESGRVVMDTRNLAPGEYTVAVVADGVAGYPFKFRVCQLEPLSDFAVYSFYPVVKMHAPYPGSPVNAYINHMPGGPGLAPYFADGDGAMDASLASYAGSLFGPARESFDRPSVDELKFMALAAMGLHTAPPYPVNMAAEDQNPQHSLPENLRNLRRRMALYMQQHADFPGLDGVGFGWYATSRGFWEYTTKMDGWQDRRNAMYGGLAWELAQKEMAKFSTNGWPEAQVKQFKKWQGARAWSTTLPRSFHEWLADARQIRPGLTMHNHKPTSWLGAGEQYPPMTYDGMSHRSAIDYHDYCSPAGCEWRPGAFLGMGNQGKQKLMSSVFTHSSRSELVPIVFGGAGRGLDGFNVNYDENQIWAETLFRIFERYGSWFRAHDPLPDVALYWTGEHAVASTVLYDMGRLRRPAMLVSPEDIYAGELARYKVLLLVGIQSFESPEILATVKAFAAKGGAILKDDSCAADIPGQSIGFAYTGKNVATSWGLAGGDGEGEHAAPWWKFTSANPEGKEKPLMAAFAKTPQLPVTTPDTDILISPLGGKDSIICFTWNKREVPLAIKGRWRQSMVMPKLGELHVAKGWYVHNLLTGKPEAAKSTANGQSVPLDFTGFEGKIFLLTQREPKSMAIRVERPNQETARLTGWLADSAGKPLADPMPFEVTLKGPDGSTLFHKFAALGPDVALDVPVPGMAASETLDLVARDLVLGTTATQTIAPAAPAVVVARPSQDFVGGEKAVLEFLSQRKGPVTILLDDEQQCFLPAAGKMAALLEKSGREARVQTWDLADILPMHLRWNPLPLDIEAANSLTNGIGWAWRINHSPFAAEKLPFSHPACGYTESGPALRHESDVVMFGTPDDNRALAQVEPYLRRKVTGNYPAPGGFFVHHIWSPFLGGYNALYVGCRDVAGAEAAVESIASLKLPAPAAPAGIADAKPLVANAGTPAPVENMAARLGGTEVWSMAFTPSGKRLFVATASFAEWFFILDPATGNVVEKRLPPVGEGFPNWWRYTRWLEPVNETSLRMGLWNGKYLYDLDKGFVSRMAGTPEHYLPAPRDGGGPKVKASTRLDDPDRDRIYLGGNDRIHAIDKAGNLKWTYYDAFASPDLHYPRGVFPRAVSGDGKVLIAAGFGVHDMLFATSMKCPGLVGIDTATGKQLWTLDGVVLNGGKVIALMDRFVVMDDDSNSFEVMAATGKKVAGLKGMDGTPQWVVQLQGGKTMLVVDNNRFSRQGRTSRVFIRSLAGGRDVVLPVTDRVVSLTFAPDKQSFVIGTVSGEIVRFSLDGAPQWKIEEPTASGRVVFSPDGRNLVLGGGDGVVRGVNAADGKVLWRRDLNGFNDIADDRFIAQAVMPEVPQDKAETPSAPPPEPSYLTSLQPGKVSFGPNLASPASVLAMLNPAKLGASSPAKPGYVGELTKPLVLNINVAKGQTYLLELLNGLVDPAHLEKGARLEVAVTTDQRGWKNLPFTAEFRIGTDLTRRRMAFRADGAGVVTLTLRATRSVTTGKGKEARTSKEDAGVPVLLGDMVVSAMRFPGRSLLFDGGPGTDSQPAALPDCTGYPHQDGTNKEKIPFKARTAALQMVNGILANPNPRWAGGVDNAEIVVKLDRPRKLSCIAIFEAGVPSTRYSIDVSGKTKAGQPASARIATVFDNTQFVNLFPCPDFEVSHIRYVWAGRFDGTFKGLGNAAACIAQFEVYAAVAEIEVEEIMNIGADDMDGGLGL